MNNDRQTYSDSDMQDYELKKYVFRKRKVSANRKKRSFPLVIKSCKMCGKYIYNDPSNNLTTTDVCCTVM